MDRIKIDLTKQWKLVVETDGSISLACAHPAREPDEEHDEDLYLIQIGCLGCADLDSAAELEEGINVIRSAGFSMSKPN